MHKTIFVCDQCAKDMFRDRGPAAITLGYNRTPTDMLLFEFCSWSCAVAYCQERMFQEAGKGHAPGESGPSL